MIWKNGNIWIYWRLGKTIVIPTNGGYKANGENVMGAGLALQASKELPDLPRIYGGRCMDRNPCFYYKEKRLILVPSKPIIEETPWLSWKQSARADTLISSLEWLESNAIIFETDVYVPLIGAGNGGLDRILVKKRMNEILTNKKFIGVEYNG